MSDDLITSLLAALAERSDDRTLRVHVAELLLGAGRPAEALGHVGQVLANEPGHAGAVLLHPAAPQARDVLIARASDPSAQGERHRAGAAAE